MRIASIAAIAGATATTLVAAPAFVLARHLRYQGFDPAKDRKPDPLDLQITAISDQTVTLRRASGKAPVGPHEPGRYRLQAARGWGHAGAVIESNEIVAIREYRPGEGDIRAGDYARLDTFAFGPDPLSAHGFRFEDVRFTSQLGEFGAWHVPGRSSTWAIMTHGKGADPREALRIMPALVDSGFHCMAITYRNDEGYPAAPTGVYSYGRDEWEELDGAVAYALAHGASDVVLVGYSMGGAITLSFMKNSEHTAAVSALILDAPMTQLEDTVEHGASISGVPVRVLPVSNRLAALMYRFDWRDFDYFPVIQALDVPVLLFHGDADKTIPVELSDSVSATRPDIVQYVRVPGAGHVRSWNVNPEAYEETVRDFVRTRRSVRAGK